MSTVFETKRMGATFVINVVVYNLHVGIVELGTSYTQDIVTHSKKLH